MCATERVLLLWNLLIVTVCVRWIARACLGEREVSSLDVLLIHPHTPQLRFRPDSATTGHVFTDLGLRTRGARDRPAMVLSRKGILALNSSAEFREKVLKALQYLAKLLVAARVGGSLAKTLAKHFSSCRRLVTFLRWVRYSDNFIEASTTTAEPLRSLLYAEAALNVTVDAMQDVVTIDKLGLLGTVRLRGAFGVSFERLAETLDALLAAVGVAVGVARLRAAAASQQLQRRLELLGYVGDLLKNVHNAELSVVGLAPGETLAAMGGLAAASLSARKLRNKLAPPITIKGD